jgi:hypothetical protein
LRENDRLKHDLKFVQSVKEGQHDVETTKGTFHPRTNASQRAPKGAKSLEADKDLIYENLRLKKEYSIKYWKCLFCRIEALVQERNTVERAFNELRDETRMEFQSIQKEFRNLTEELSMNVVKKCKGKVYLIHLEQQ